MRLKDQERDIIVKTIRQYFPAPEFQIILFGSYATNRAHLRSDIDIAIKGSGPLPADKWALLEDEFAESDFPKSIDIIDYYRVAQAFQNIIDVQGVPL